MTVAEECCSQLVKISLVLFFISSCSICVSFEDTLVILLNNILGSYRKYCSDMRKACFNVEADQVLERLLRTMANFLCSEMLRLPGEGPWQPALAEPASGMSTRQVTSSPPFQPQLLCDSLFSDCIELGVGSLQTRLHLSWYTGKLLGRVFSSLCSKLLFSSVGFVSSLSTGLIYFQGVADLSFN